MEPPQIAVLMTSHNRREKTLSALTALAGQHSVSAVVRTHLVDAGSSDGTAGAVRAAHPGVEVMEVGPDVYWGHGMRLASRNSRMSGAPHFDHQLWLNDDVVLDADALSVLLDTAAAVGSAGGGAGGGDAVIVGATRARPEYVVVASAA
ncbi:glycosyltransferase family 2 protein, partial [Streptomyces beijiangensis]|nr:hypothetical protein [Streptomyces beijiangensis]